jgi:hypothetical protein
MFPVGYWLIVWLMGAVRDREAMYMTAVASMVPGINANGVKRAIMALNTAARIMYRRALPQFNLTLEELTSITDTSEIGRI